MRGTPDFQTRTWPVRLLAQATPRTGHPCFLVLVIEASSGPRLAETPTLGRAQAKDVGLVSAMGFEPMTY